jgi:hypothetical protein
MLIEEARDAKSYVSTIIAGIAAQVANALRIFSNLEIVALSRKMKCIEDLFRLQLSEIGMLQCVLLGFLRYNNDTRVTLR